MKLLNLLALFLILLVKLHLCYIADATSEYTMIAGIQWGVMRTHIITKDLVYHLEEDYFVKGNILYSDGSVLMTTDGNSTHVIVGSTYGYVEGKSSQAQFRTITGFLQTNSSHVLMVDHDNHCLRYVSRVNNVTSPFAGTCTLTGFIDGKYNNARFFKPRSIIRDVNNQTAAILTDFQNKALRYIDFLRGDVTTLIQLLPDHPWNAAFSSYNNNIFITIGNFIGKFHVRSSTFSPLTPIGSDGGQDGDFSKVSFHFPRGIICVSNVCIVADAATHKLRIMDTSKELVHSICSGNRANVDGSTAHCSLRQPHSLLLLSGNLYIGEYQAIRSISVRDMIPCKDITAKLSAGEEEKCIRVLYDHHICFPYGTYTYKIQENNCVVKIHILKELDACQSMPCLNSGICISGENNTYKCACHGEWTGRNCQNEINACLFKPCRNSGKCTAMQGGFACSCTAGWTGINCDKEIDVCMTMPCLNSGLCEADENNTYFCACRDGWRGNHCETEINACTISPCRNSGLCLPVNSTFRCSCLAGWTGIICEKALEVQNNSCLKQIHVAADPKTMKTKVMLPDGDTIMLPVGRYVFEKQQSNNITCETAVHVSDPKLMMRLDVYANYNLPCNVLGNFKDLIHTIAQARYSQIKLLSSGVCNQLANEDVIMLCASGLLKVVWPTDCIFDVMSVEERETTLLLVHGNIKKASGFILDLVIPSHMPPIIQPSLNQEGLPASVTLTPVCTGGLTYINSTETCQ